LATHFICTCNYISEADDVCTGEWTAELFEAAAGVERLDCEHAAAFEPEHQEPPYADAVRARELQPPVPQERTLAVPAYLDAPDLAERADDERRGPIAASVQVPSELVGDSLQK